MVDNIIKRQTLSLVVIVITLITFIFSTLYIFFFDINNYSESKKDFEISFCYDKSCNNKYYNYSNLIGINSSNNKTSLREIKKYNNNLSILLDTPYIFSIKNNIKDSNIALKLNFNKNYLDDTSYKSYLDDIYVGISKEYKGIKTYKYTDIRDYIFDDINIKNNEEIKFFMWVWLEKEHDEKVYFPANIEIVVLN